MGVRLSVTSAGGGAVALAASPPRPGAKRRRLVPRARARLAARSTRLGPARLGTSVACAAVLAAEVLGSLVMWAAIPLAWIWIAGRSYEATDSLVLAGGIALLGLAVTEGLAAKALARADLVWIALRRRAGHNQTQGALTRLVVASATVGLAGFLVWYYLLSHAYIIPFMPSQ